MGRWSLVDVKLILAISFATNGLATDKIISNLKQKYSNRRAMIEELSKIKFPVSDKRDG